MPWPDSYNDRHAALQRAMRTVMQHMPAERAQAVTEALYEDKEALVEFSDALGLGDMLAAAAAALKGGNAP